MKRYLVFALVLMSALTGMAQTYDMDVVLKNGTHQRFPADSVSEVRFVTNDDEQSQDVNILTDQYFPDAELRKAVKTQVAGGRDILSAKDAASYQGGLTLHTPYVKDFSGIELLKSLTSLQADGVYATTLDVSKLSNLKILTVRNSMIQNLNLGDPKQLRKLDIGRSKLTNYDLSVLPDEMSSIKVDGLEYTALDFTRFKDIDTISCSQNKLTSLKVEGLTHLKSIIFSTNDLKEVSLKGCCALEMVVGTYNFNLASVDVTGCNSLKHFMFMYTGLEQFDVTPFASTIEELNLGWTKIKTLDISKCSNLTYLAVNNCDISDELDFSACTKLDELRVESTHIPSIDLSNCPDISVLQCYEIDKLKSLKLASHLRKLYQLNIDTDPLLETFEWGSTDKLQYANIYSTPLKRIDLSKVNKDYKNIYLENNSNLSEIKVWKDFDLNNPPANIQKDATAKFVYEFSQEQ